MQNSIPNSNISIISEEIFVEILSGFPVKTWLLLKCACKHWCTLISNPWFISVHLQRLSLKPDDAHYILVQRRGGTSCLIPILNPSRLINLARPCGSDYSVVGSINGLVCLSVGVHKMICLWNPLIKQFKLLPNHNIKERKEHKCIVSLGFGYEKDSDDYKVKRILNYYKAREMNIVEVYSTKLDSWRKVKTDVCLNVTNTRCAATVQGFNYWVIINTDEPHKSFVASFNLRSEMFSTIPVPEVLVTQSHDFRAINYHGSLALLAYPSHCEFKECLEVWVIEGGREIHLWHGF